MNDTQHIRGPVFKQEPLWKQRGIKRLRDVEVAGDFDEHDERAMKRRAAFKDETGRECNVAVMHAFLDEVRERTTSTPWFTEGGSYTQAHTTSSKLFREMDRMFQDKRGADMPPYGRSEFEGDEMRAWRNSYIRYSTRNAATWAFYPIMMDRKYARAVEQRKNKRELRRAELKAARKAGRRVKSVNLGPHPSRWQRFPSSPMPKPCLRGMGWLTSFLASVMREAIKKVKAELGDDVDFFGNNCTVACRALSTDDEVLEVLNEVLEEIAVRLAPGMRLGCDDDNDSVMSDDILATPQSPEI